MTFWQRVVNVLGTAAYIVFRDYWMIPQVEEIIDTHFPEDKNKRPNLLELERQAGLAFQFGHPLIMDGLRPTSSNYIMIGTASPNIK